MPKKRTKKQVSVKLSKHSSKKSAKHKLEPKHDSIYTYLEFFKEFLTIHRNFIYAALVVFILGFLAAFILPVKLKLEMFNQLALLVESIQTNNNFLLSFSIFTNNLYVAVLFFALGFTFFMPFILLFSNAVVIGLMLLFLCLKVLLPYSPRYFCFLVVNPLMLYISFQRCRYIDLRFSA
ncbi:stage II sporulation protein M, partial [Candidatus Woesearchaeota archaeon]|nr:stage II sporulation protein M [Candidatus Woesearchaeota archaeon]